jgi:type I restriction enzyme S subunit
MGALLQERGETNVGQKEQHVLSLLRHRGVIPYDEKGRIGNKKSENIERYKIVRPNDIVVNSMNVIIGSVGISKYTGCLSPVYYVLKTRSERDSPFYLNYVFQIEQFQKSLIGIGNGILAHRMRIAMEKFKCELFPRPPIDEQHLIVRYLHALDAKVKRYIRTKRSLITRLQEQKQAIIQRAVTRGLDPNVKLKPSGVEWLGEVPEHWEVKKLKRLGQVRIGLIYSPGDLTGEQGTLVLRASNIRHGRIVPADNVYVSKKIPEMLKVVEGDLLICVRSGSRNLVGKSGMITKEYEGVSYGAFMSLLRSKDNDYIFWVLNSNMLPCVMAQFETSTINQLTQSDLRNLSIPMPPDAERAQILNYLSSATAEVDAGIDIVHREISTLLEYHTRLIADVVTGAVDVREAARKLPEVDETISGTEDEMMDEEPLSMAAEGEETYENE